MVISTEMLEHDKYWKLSLRVMYNLLKKDGLFVLTCAAPERKEHGTTYCDRDNSPFTNDYYQNVSIEDFYTILPPTYFSYCEIKYGREQQDLYFYGTKK